MTICRYDHVAGCKWFQDVSEEFENYCYKLKLLTTSNGTQNQ